MEYEKRLSEDVVILSVNRGLDHTNFMEPKPIMRVLWAARDISPRFLEVPLADYDPEAAEKEILRLAAELTGTAPPPESETKAKTEE